MPARRRELKPDSKGRYRPYLGFRVDAEGNRKEYRFNLGTDKREAERRMARLTQPEAAEVLGISLATVKRRWQSARIRLSETLDGETFQ